MDMDGSEYIVVDEFDNHFNYKTHKLIKRIIENIEELGLLTQPNYD